MFDMAIEYYNAAIRLDPDSATLRTLRGSAYSKNGRPDLAMVDLDQAIILMLDHAMAYYNRGDAHTKVGQDLEARTDYDMACRLDSKFCK